MTGGRRFLLPVVLLLVVGACSWPGTGSAPAPAKATMPANLPAACGGLVPGRDLWPVIGDYRMIPTSTNFDISDSKYGGSCEFELNYVSVLFVRAYGVKTEREQNEDIEAAKRQAGAVVGVRAVSSYLGYGVFQALVQYTQDGRVRTVQVDVRGQEDTPGKVRAVYDLAVRFAHAYCARFKFGRPFAQLPPVAPSASGSTAAVRSFAGS